MSKTRNSCTTAHKFVGQIGKHFFFIAILCIHTWEKNGLWPIFEPPYWSMKGNISKAEMEQFSNFWAELFLT